MSEYVKGAAACDAIDAVKLQRSNRHRDTNDSRSKPVEARMAAMSRHMKMPLTLLLFEAHAKMSRSKKTFVCVRTP